MNSDIIECGNISLDAVSFRKNLLRWGKKHFRPFPWRFSTDPYRILMAEIMLHRTQANQVVPVYEKFIEQFSSIATLFRAEQAQVQAILYSLGLHWRVDLIRKMVVMIEEKYNGSIPEIKQDLLLLPGVSDYIASAVRCFAWNYPEALIDTNTVRVIGRVFGLEIKDSSRRNPVFRRLISMLVDRKHPRQYNYSLLDLANQVCYKTKAPDCNSCPLRKSCVYGAIKLDLL